MTEAKNPLAMEVLSWVMMTEVETTSAHILRKDHDQVLRYYREDIKAEPLWPWSTGRPSKSVIPKCNDCDGPTCCEFQIMPQLLYYLKVENNLDPLDWATIVVYACEASCQASLPYKEEYAWVQFSKESKPSNPIIEIFFSLLFNICTQKY
ncbi:hypothetical protein RJT34_23535 [Clitoria ternatea]|uniref:Programmed cell death protein 2 C-terminal domain-containing protein n=1 Tax=Clitoria ternatea TaxID=43366 RepID=A0AAN9FSH0_CLITE